MDKNTERKRTSYCPIANLRKLTDDPATSITTITRNVIHSFSLPDDVKKKMIPTISVVLRFYGLPKICPFIPLNGP